MRSAWLTLSAMFVVGSMNACAEPPASAPPSQAQSPLLPQAPAKSQPGSLVRVEYAGDGCTASDATTGISPDGQAFTSVFSNFLVAAGPAHEPGQSVRGCLLQVVVDVPAGWAYALASVDYRGFAALDEGVTATRSALYFVPGTQPEIPPPAVLSGPLDDDFAARDLGEGARLRYSPCGGGQQRLFIATNVAIDPGQGGGSGSLAVDSLDGELAWRRCH